MADASASALTASTTSSAVEMGFPVPSVAAFTVMSVPVTETESGVLLPLTTMATVIESPATPDSMAVQVISSVPGVPVVLDALTPERSLSMRVALTAESVALSVMSV